MKVEILTQFRDRFHFKRVYNPGEVAEFDNDRAAILIARGLAKAAEVTETAKAEDTPKKRTSGKGKKSAKAKAAADANVEAETPATESAEHTIAD